AVRGHGGSGAEREARLTSRFAQGLQRSGEASPDPALNSVYAFRVGPRLGANLAVIAGRSAQRERTCPELPRLLNWVYLPAQVQPLGSAEAGTTTVNWTNSVG